MQGEKKKLPKTQPERLNHITTAYRGQGLFTDRTFRRFSGCDRFHTTRAIINLTMVTRPPRRYLGVVFTSNCCHVKSYYLIVVAYSDE